MHHRRCCIFWQGPDRLSNSSITSSKTFPLLQHRHHFLLLLTRTTTGNHLYVEQKPMIQANSYCTYTTNPIYLLLHTTPPLSGDIMYRNKTPRKQPSHLAPSLIMPCTSNQAISSFSLFTSRTAPFPYVRPEAIVTGRAMYTLKRSPLPHIHISSRTVQVLSLGGIESRPSSIPRFAAPSAACASDSPSSSA